MTTTSRVSKCLFSGSPKYFYPSYPISDINLSSFQLLCEDLSHFDTPKAQSQTVQVCVRAAFKALLRSPRVCPPNGAPQGWHYVLSFTSFTPKTCGDVMVFRHRNSSVRIQPGSEPIIQDKKEFRKPLQLAQLNSRLCDGFRFSTCGCSTRVAVWCAIAAERHSRWVSKQRQSESFSSSDTAFQNPSTVRIYNHIYHLSCQIMWSKGRLCQLNSPLSKFSTLPTRSASSTSLCACIKEVKGYLPNNCAVSTTKSPKTGKIAGNPRV